MKIERIFHTCEKFESYLSYQWMWRIRVSKFKYAGMTNTYALRVTISSQTSVCHAFIFVRSVQILLKFRARCPSTFSSIAIELNLKKMT